MPKIIENLESRLLEEARKQVDAYGYSALTVRSVAKACGVGIGTVYNYFTSKDEMLATYMLADWKSCIAAIHEAGECAVSPTPLIRCIHDQLLLFADLHKSVFRDKSASVAFSGSLSHYHAMLRSQLSAPLKKFCQQDFTADFIAEALLTWTMASKNFDDIYGVIEKLF